VKQERDMVINTYECGQTGCHR